MSTSVAHPGTTHRSGRSGAVVGMAAVALAAVIAIGFVVADNQAGDNAVADIQGVHPQVDSSIARRQWLKEQAALNAQPSVNPDIARAEQYQEFLEGRAQQAAAARTTSPEIHRANGYAGSVGSATGSTSATVNPEVQQAQAYLDFLNSRAQGLEGMWDQRNNDLVERFENQYNGGNGLTPLQGRF